MNTYDERAVVLSYIDAQLPPYPHEDFKLFRQEKVKALESCLKIRISAEGANPSCRALWFLFSGAVNSYLGLRGPRSGMLEAGLIELHLDRVDGPAFGLREHEKRIHRHLEESKFAHLDLLVSLFRALWHNIPTPITSSDLMTVGFDDAKEPKLSNYYDIM